MGCLSTPTHLPHLLQHRPIPRSLYRQFLQNSASVTLAKGKNPPEHPLWHFAPPLLPHLRPDLWWALFRPPLPLFGEQFEVFIDVRSSLPHPVNNGFRPFPEGCGIEDLKKEIPAQHSPVYEHTCQLEESADRGEIHSLLGSARVFCPVVGIVISREFV